jgi:hypothetical protein
MSSNLGNSLGMYYEEQNDVENMMKYYLIAIDKGCSYAMNNLGCYYKEQNDVENMMKYYLMAIKNNYCDTQTVIAKINSHIKNSFYIKYMDIFINNRTSLYGSKTKFLESNDNVYEDLFYNVTYWSSDDKLQQLELLFYVKGPSTFTFRFTCFTNYTYGGDLSCVHEYFNDMKLRLFINKTGTKAAGIYYYPQHKEKCSIDANRNIIGVYDDLGHLIFDGDFDTREKYYGLFEHDNVKYIDKFYKNIKDDIQKIEMNYHPSYRLILKDNLLVEPDKIYFRNGKSVKKLDLQEVSIKEICFTKDGFKDLSYDEVRRELGHIFAKDIIQIIETHKKSPMWHQLFHIQYQEVLEAEKKEKYIRKEYA